MPKEDPDHELDTLDQAALYDSVPGKQATGGWFGLEQTGFARHREDHLRRHAERAVRTLMVLLRNYTFDVGQGQPCLRKFHFACLSD
jgi:hypothetical protein